MRMMMINSSSVAMPILFGAAGALVGVGPVFWTVAVAVGCGTRLSSRLRGDRTS